MGEICVNNKILIENFQKQKTWGWKKLLKEFPSNSWPWSGLDSLLRQTELEPLCLLP